MKRMMPLALGVLISVVGARTLYAYEMSEHFGQIQVLDGVAACEGWIAGLDANDEDSRILGLWLYGPDEVPLAGAEWGHSHGEDLHETVQHATVGSGWYHCRIEFTEYLDWDDQANDTQHFYFYLDE